MDKEQIKIQFTPIHSRILTPLSKELNLKLYNNFAYQSEGYYFSQAYQSCVVYVELDPDSLPVSIQEFCEQYKDVLGFRYDIDYGIFGPSSGDATYRLYPIRSAGSKETQAQLFKNFVLSLNLQFGTCATMVCKHVWDGWNRRYNVIKQSFRSGLLNSVCKFLQAEGYRVTVYGYPPPSKFEPREATHESRQFQIDGAKSVLEVPFHKFGIFQAPPRSGKTNIMVSIVDSERKFPVVVFCRSKDLMAQTMRRFQKYLPTVAAGCVGDGIVDIQDVTVITVQSAFAAYNEKYKDTATDLEKDIPDKAAVRLCIRNARVVFYDEVHHAHSRTSRFVLDKCKSAEIRIGMSATPHPDNEEEMKIEETVGPIVHKISYSVLIEAGFILRPYIYMYSLPEMIIDDHYKAVYKEAVSENEYLTDFIRQLVEQLTQKGKSVVIQTDYTKHTKILAKVIPNSYILTGKETTPERNEILEKLNRKEILCVVSTLFEEGLDVPSLDYTINAAGGLSNVSTLQRMRSMTAHDGKTTCGVIDFYHDCKYLRDHSEVRKEQYLSEPAFVFEERSSSTIGDLP